MPPFQPREVIRVLVRHGVTGGRLRDTVAEWCGALGTASATADIKGMTSEDRAILEAFATRVRAFAPSAAVWAFGSRARGSADPESDLDLCVVVPETSQLRDRIYEVAWEMGLDHGRLIAPIVLSEDDFQRSPLSASSLVAAIRREGVAA